MAARPTHDLTVKTGEYTDRNGQNKGRWLRVGTVFRHDDGGISIKLDCVPVGMPGWDGWVSVFRREEQAQPGTGATHGAPAHHQPHRGNGAGHPPPAGFDDDIPF